MSCRYHIINLSANSLEPMKDLLSLFGEVFDQREVYCNNQPGNGYLTNLLGSDSFIALVACHETQVIGGLTAYELKKFEQERSEIYIYDLAVHRDHRRLGIATRLIQTLCDLARGRGISTVFVQADTSKDDEPAIALYSKLGIKEEVLHFDITRPFLSTR